MEGRVVEILKFKEAEGQAEGRYIVRGALPSYWACAVCGEINRRERDACNVCHLRRRTAGQQAYEDFEVSARQVMLPPGAQVRVDGLVGFPELNGQVGVVLAFDRRSGRYHVQLPDGRPRAIRPPHVGHLSSAQFLTQDGGDVSRWAPPAVEPSLVDELEPPTNVLCNSDTDLYHILSQVDSDMTLKRDVQHGDLKLCKGQRLLREGELKGHSIGELRRGALRLTLRFASRTGLAAYADAIRELDAFVEELYAQHSAGLILPEGAVAERKVLGPPATRVRVSYLVGEPVRYTLAMGSRRWIDTSVLEVDPVSGEMRVACFPTYWLSLAEQAARLLRLTSRPRTNPAFYNSGPGGASSDGGSGLSESEVVRARRDGQTHWICRHCGYVNGIDADYCDSCDPDV